MSDIPSGETAVLNWRGPLLATAIFASVFGILLLMAHLNQSKTSDAGSSFRQDPYGTSLLFDAYQRAGYQLKRSQDQRSLADEDATRTTAFFVGGYENENVESRDGKIVQGEKFHGRLEGFLARGGRVVLLGHEPGVSVASFTEAEGKPKQGAGPWRKEKTWGIENEYDSKNKHESAPAWATPNFPAMPADSEKIYLGAEVPWLKTDAQWIALYARPVNAKNGPPGKAKPDGETRTHVYLAMRRVGDGELVVASQKSFLLNEVIKTHPNPVLLEFLAGGRSVIWVDETLHGLHQEEGVLWLVQRYRLQGALLLFWATLLALLWSMSGDLVRHPAPEGGAEIIRNGQAAGVAAQRVLQRSIEAEQVVAECWDQFRRRSPQDAKAISADPRWGPRLRSALAQPPLAGYKELMHLIAERRASAKGLVRADRDDSNAVTSPKNILEEARIG
jgi:hypothetical protein